MPLVQEAKREPSMRSPNSENTAADLGTDGRIPDNTGGRNVPPAAVAENAPTLEKIRRRLQSWLVRRSSE